MWVPEAHILTEREKIKQAGTPTHVNQTPARSWTRWNTRHTAPRGGHSSSVSSCCTSACTWCCTRDTQTVSRSDLPCGGGGLRRSCNLCRRGHTWRASRPGVRWRCVRWGRVYSGGTVSLGSGDIEAGRLLRLPEELDFACSPASVPGLNIGNLKQNTSSDSFCMCICGASDIVVLMHHLVTSILSMDGNHLIDPSLSFYLHARGRGINLFKLGLGHTGPNCRFRWTILFYVFGYIEKEK